MQWRIGRTRVVLLMLALVFGIGWSKSAWSAARVKLTAPDGWVTSAHADQSALVRANSWAERSGLNLVQLLATADRDDFVETAALFETSEPLVARDLSDASAALARIGPVVAKMIVSGAAPVRQGFAPASQHEQPVFVAVYDVGETTYHVASMPASSEHAVFVLAYKSSERSLYEPQFERLLTGIEGIAAPVVPFPRKLWRWGTVLGWALLGLGAYLVALLFGERRGDYRTAGERAALALVVLGACVMMVIWWALGRDVAAVEAAGTTASAVAIEIAIVGAIVAALLFAFTRLLGRELRIQSAPTQGAFSGRSTVLHRTGSELSTSRPLPGPLESSDGQGEPGSDLASSGPPRARGRRSTLQWGGAPLADGSSPEESPSATAPPRPPRPPPKPPGRGA